MVRQEPDEPLPATDASIRTLHIEQRFHIEASRQVVWDLLTRRLSDWWQHPNRIYDGDADIRLELRPHGSLVEQWAENGFATWGYVSHLDPGETLELTGPCGMGGAVHGVFSFHLEERAGGVDLRLVHDALGVLRPGMLEAYEEGWSRMLATLKSLAEGPLRYGANARSV